MRPARRPLRAPEGYRFPDRGLLDWEHVDGRLAAAQFYWLCTVRPSGPPHATPLWGSWTRQALYVDGAPSTRWARNLSVNAAVSVHLESGADVVILEGLAEDVFVDADLARIITDDWMRKYGRLAPDPVDGIFRIVPRSVRAWSSPSLEDGTGWSFDEVRP